MRFTNITFKLVKLFFYKNVAIQTHETLRGTGHREVRVNPLSCSLTKCPTTLDIQRNEILDTFAERIRIQGRNDDTVVT